ncbi:hypothetical protein GGI05_007080, partial [Coemansia sp. RSA 2603]
MVETQDVILPDWVPGTRNYHIRASVMMAISVVYTLFVLVTSIMFILKSRNKRSGLSKRYVTIVIFQAFGCYLAGVNGLVTAALNNWACFGKLWLFNMGFLISLSAMSVRAFHLMVTYKVHELSSVLSTRNPKGIDSLHSLSPKNGSFEKFGKLVVGSGDSVVTVSKSVSRLKQARQLEKYKRLLPYVRERMLIFYMTVFILIGIILTLVINITDKQFGIRPVKSICIFYWGFLPITAVVVVFFFLVFPVVLWRIWRDNDAYGIRNDLIICDTVGIVCMVITLIWVNLLHETQQKWPGLSFVWVYAIFIHITSVFIPLLRSIQHMRLSEDHDRTFTAENMMDDGPQMSLNISRRAAFNRMFDDPLEYQHFRTFAAS